MAALNIKNAETHALARELADRTGESLTDAVTTAVRERLERLGSAPDDVEARLAAVRAISEDMARRWGPYDPTEDPTAFLYDEQTGLPR